MGLKQLLIDSGDNFRQRLLTPDYTLPGGTNNAPLITKAMPGVEENPNSNKEFINSVTDGFVPGGGILAAERAYTDTQRISNFLLTGEGISFVAKDAAIQRANPQNLVSPTNRTRLPLNLLAQIPVNIAGAHIRRDGVVDTTFESNFNYDPEKRGGKKYDQEITSLINSDEESSSPHTLLSTYLDHNYSIIPSNIIKEYSGGAGSFFGVGNTQITKYPSGRTGNVQFTFEPENSPIPLPGSDTSKPENRDYLQFGPQLGENNFENSNSLLYNYKTFKVEGLLFSKEYNNVSKFNLKPVDLGPGKTDELQHRQYNEFTTNPITREDTNPPVIFDSKNERFRSNSTNPIRAQIRATTSEYQLGDPDQKYFAEVDGGYTIVSPYKNLSVDKLNESWTSDQDPSFITRNSFDFDNEEIAGLKDYIKFRIALIDTTNPLKDEVLLFRAHLENVNDNFNSTWNSFKYNGRAENFYTYGGFDREMSFSFKIGAQSKEELKPLWKKLNYLVGSTAPQYVNRRIRGRFVRLTIGDWCYEVPGFFTSVQLNWTTSFPWNIDEAPDHFSDAYDTSQHPMILNVSCNFKPIHDFTPESEHDKPFIIRVPVKRPSTNEEITQTQEVLASEAQILQETEPGTLEFENATRTLNNQRVVSDAPFGDLIAGTNPGNSLTF